MDKRYKSDHTMITESRGGKGGKGGKYGKGRGNESVTVTSGGMITTECDTSSLTSSTMTIPVEEGTKIVAFAVSSDATRQVAITQAPDTGYDNPSGDMSEDLDSGLRKMWLSDNSGTTWTNSNAPVKQYSAIHSSSDGYTIVAISGRDHTGGAKIVISRNAGSTWTDVPLPESCRTKKTDGSDVPEGTACVFPFTYKFKEYNAPTTVENNGTPWCSTHPEGNGGSDQWGDAVCSKFTVYREGEDGKICLSGDGRTLFAYSINVEFVSMDSGATWVERQRERDQGKHFIDVAMSSNGRIFAAISDDGWIWGSSDSGKSWSKDTLQDTMNGKFNSITMSSDGEKVAVTSTQLELGYAGTEQRGGSIRTTSNFSASGSIADWDDFVSKVPRFSPTWIVRDTSHCHATSTGLDRDLCTPTSGPYVYIAMSSNGTKLASVAKHEKNGVRDGPPVLWTSCDSGVTWFEKDSTEFEFEYGNIFISDDGRIFTFDTRAYLSTVVPNPNPNPNAPVTLMELQTKYNDLQSVITQLQTHNTQSEAKYNELQTKLVAQEAKYNELQTKLVAQEGYSKDKNNWAAYTISGSTN